MFDFDPWQVQFTATAFLFQVILIAHFALRKWRFATAIRFGPLVYAFGIPAAAVSVLLLSEGVGWSFWAAGFLCLAWAIFGYLVDYALKIDWRSSPKGAAFVLYLLLYLAANMFYWFPLALIWRPLVYIYAVFYAAATWLNITSHQAG